MWIRIDMTYILLYLNIWETIGYLKRRLLLICGFIGNGEIPNRQYIYIKDWGLWETFHHGVSLVFWLSDGEYTMGKYVGNARHCHFRLEVRSFLLSHILFRCLHPLTLPVPSPFFLVKFANDICSACSVFVDPTDCSLLLLYVTRKELTP